MFNTWNNTYDNNSFEVRKQQNSLPQTISALPTSNEQQMELKGIIHIINKKS